MSRRKLLANAGLFALLLLPLASRLALIGGDEVHYALMAHSIAVDGDFELADDYAEVEGGALSAGRKKAGERLDPHLRPVGERMRFTHPLGLPLLAAPFVALQQLLAPGAPPDLLLLGLTFALTSTALFAARRTVATWIGDEPLATFWTFGGFFATPLWFYGRTFFTEPFVIAFAVLAVAAIANQRLARAAIFLGLALAMKEAALLIVAPVLLAVGLQRGLRPMVKLSLGPLAAACLYPLTNRLQGLPLWSGSQEFQFGSFVDGLTGLLFDSRHGLLPFAGFAVLAGVAGFAAFWKRRATTTRGPVAIAAAAIALCSLLLHAAWIDWTGGSCYGPRLVLPAVAALLALAVFFRPKSIATRSVLTLAMALGFAVQVAAALAPHRAFWGVPVLELLSARPVAPLAGALGAVWYAWKTLRLRDGVAVSAESR